MRAQLKPLDQQVIVITGASSGIGLTTARMAASKGACVVLAARNETALRQIADEITFKGGRAVYVVADVGKEEDVRGIAETAVHHFGGFDTWVNGAAVAIFGRIDEVPLEDQRRLFETNYWGVVHGSIVAAKHLRQNGGALINIGSVLSDVAMPLQGPYSAAKHAVKGFSDAFRIELEAIGARISVTLIKPASIDTPYVDHAKNYMAVEPKYPPPVYAPELVAEAILHAAQHPVRDLYVGGGAKAMAAMRRLAPRLTDRMTERTAFRAQQSGKPAIDRSQNSLYKPSVDGDERSQITDQKVLRSSIYTKATMHPMTTAAIAVGISAAAAALLRGRHAWNGSRRQEYRIGGERRGDRARAAL